MGRFAKLKGTRNERKAVKALNGHFRTLMALRVPGSGSFANRGICTDPGLVGDIRILDKYKKCVERIEVKSADPNRKKGPITHAFIKRVLKGRRIVMARHDRGAWICALEREAWKAMADCQWQSVNPLPTRGQTIEDIQDMAIDLGGLWLLWGSVMFGTVKQLAVLLEEVYGE